MRVSHWSVTKTMSIRAGTLVVAFWLTLPFLACASDAKSASTTPTTPSTLAPATDLVDPVSRSVWKTAAQLDERWTSTWEKSGPAPGTDAQRLSTLLIDAAYLGWHPERLLKVVGWLESLRETDPRKKNYLNLNWYWGDKAVVDANGVEFLNRQAVLAWIIGGDKLSPDLRVALEQFLRQNLEGIQRHKVNISYTNITLMKAWNLLAIGEWLPDAGAFTEGKKLLADWLAEVRKNGVREFLSPTYTAVDFENLGLIIRFTKDQAIRHQAQAGMDYLWAVVFAHWMPQAERLGGTHSRDYDRLDGHGPLDRWVKRALLTDSPFSDAMSNLAWAAPGKAVITSPIQPDSSAIIRWDPHSFATWYRGKSFGIGSATDNYWDMDKTPFLVDLGVSPDSPQVSFWMDGRKDYYGFALVKESSGHMKSLHLKPILASAQRKNEVLFAASAHSEKQDNIESTFTLPSDARFYLDTTELKPFNKRSLWTANPAAAEPATAMRIEKVDNGTAPKSVLTIEDNDAALGIGVQRVFAVTPGASYRTTVVSWGSGFSLYHNYLDRNGGLLQSENIQSVSASVAEKTTTQQTVAPAGAASIRVWLYSSSRNQGRIHLSDVQVDELASGKTTRLASFDWSTPEAYEQSIPVGKTLFVRQDNTTLALRILEAKAADGSPAPIVLSNDGLQHGAFRLTATHARAPTNDRGVIVVYAAVADTVDEAAFQAFRSKALAVTTENSIENNRVLAKVNGTGGLLSVDADWVTKARIVDPSPAPSTEGTFWINEDEKGAALLTPGQIKAEKP